QTEQDKAMLFNNESPACASGRPTLLRGSCIKISRQPCPLEHSGNQHQQKPHAQCSQKNVQWRSKQVIAHPLPYAHWPPRLGLGRDGKKALAHHRSTRAMCRLYQFMNSEIDKLTVK